MSQRPLDDRTEGTIGKAVRLVQLKKAKIKAGDDRKTYTVYDELKQIHTALQRQMRGSNALVAAAMQINGGKIFEHLPEAIDLPAGMQERKKFFADQMDLYDAVIAFLDKSDGLIDDDKRYMLHHLYLNFAHEFGAQFADKRMTR